MYICDPIQSWLRGKKKKFSYMSDMICNAILIMTYVFKVKFSNSFESVEQKLISIFYIEIIYKESGKRDCQ